ncbi:MAG: deoxyribonuclease IV [Spirochaetales bacterium]|nr:deoxyribonuclease IV [Spirochaetales bacterium]
MKYIGAHVSTAGGVFNAPVNAKQIGATAFALFTKNQRQWQSKPLTPEDVKQFREQMELCGYEPFQVLPHDSYLINLGNPDPEKRKRSLASFIHEMQRVQVLGLDRLNFHPGAHMKIVDPSESIRYVAEGLNQALAETDGVSAVIETTAGQGSALGRTFEEIAAIIDLVQQKERIGVCIDTCHIFAAGYDIRNEETYGATMEQFGSIVGFDKLMGAHLNDAKSEFSSRVDRHHSLGKGNIGLDTFSLLMKDPRFDTVPLILETIDSDIWGDEIALLKDMAK